MFEDVSLERKKELKNIALKIRLAIMNRYPNVLFDQTEFLAKALQIYKKEFGELLINSEKNYFTLYIMIPDDNEFFNTCQNNKNEITEFKMISSTNRYDFEKIAKFYAVNPYIAKQRYKLMLENFRNGLVGKEENKNYCKK